LKSEKNSEEGRDHVRIERQRDGRQKKRFSLAVVVAGGIFFLQINTSGPTTAEKTGVMVQQFISEGHVLGFGMSAVYIASADHMIKIELEGGQSVAPDVGDNMALKAGDPKLAPPLGRISYPDVWDGVTVVYDRRPGAIVESTYRVEAGESGNPVERIRVRYNRPVRIDQRGELVIKCDNGELRESEPVAWQEIGKERERVSVAYRLIGDREVGFEVGDYDRDRELVIDPALTWNAFLGGSGWDAGRGIAIDAAGNVYVAGYSDGTWGLPARPYSSKNDAFAAKLDSDGNLIWNTFLGGSGTDNGYGIAVDGNGNVYVTGSSAALWGSPVNAYTDGLDAFAAKLDSLGNLLWNTFLGGSGADGGYSIAADESGNVYVAGYSTDGWGSPIRDYSGGYDGFAAKLDSLGNLLWNTFLGDTGLDESRSIAVDQIGNVYVAGYSTVSWGSPVTSYASYDCAFVVMLDSGGNLTWNAMLGSGVFDYGYAIAVDSSGNIYVAGSSSSTWGSPIIGYVSGYDAFAAMLDSSGTLIWNTFLGGYGADHGYGIAVDGSGNVYIAGYGYGTWGSPVTEHTAGYNAFAAKLDNGGNLTWNTFLGGGSDFGEGVAVDGNGNVYVVGTSSAAWGSPIRAYASKYDAFVAKIPETPAEETKPLPSHGSSGRARSD
jgi:hypothetical protein